MQEQVKGKIENTMNEECQADCHISFKVREHRIILASGVLTILFTFFILIMRLKYPSADGNRIIFYSALSLLFIVGIICCIRGTLRGLCVEEMDICYVNWRGRKKEFTLDDIGYCKLELSSNQDNLIIYDLLGCKLCKLEFGMKGCKEFLQYLLDNQVRMEWKKEQTDYSEMPVLETLLCETAVCEEEITKYADILYGKIRDVFLEWEKQNKAFGAYWEFGYSEFAADDVEGKSDLWNCTSSISEKHTGLPEDYVCILECYLKKDNEYVIDRKNEVVCLLIPYLVRGTSYQIGERLRFRKMNEDVVIHWTKGHLEILTKILPKRKYHTESLVFRHELRKSAGKRG